jgi:hypothetical protein
MEKSGSLAATLGSLVALVRGAAHERVAKQVRHKMRREVIFMA